MGRDDMSEARKQLEQTLRKFTVYMFNLILITQARKKSSYFRVFCTISVAEKIWKKLEKIWVFALRNDGNTGRCGRSTHLSWETSYTRTHSFYCASECKQTKERQRGLFMDPYFYLFMWLSGFFSFFLPKYKYNRIELCYNRLQFVKEIQISTVSNTERRTKLRIS